MKTKKVKWDIEKLSPTQFSTVEDKIKFANQFVAFCDSGFSPQKFPKWFYTRLSMCFGMIAHYNQSGFYNYYFERATPVDFIQDVLNYPCYGQAEFTYCDIEKQIQNWLKSEINK